MSRMYGQIVSPLSRFRFAVALLAMLGGMYAAIDLHTHQSGLHAPTVCHVCEIEQALSGGCAPQHEWHMGSTRPADVVMLLKPRLYALVDRYFTPIRAPPNV